MGSPHQTFAYAPAEGATPASPAVKAAFAIAVEAGLDAAPKARQPHKGGFVTRPPMRVACPGCKSLRIQVPIAATASPEGHVLAWFGKGTCTCPDCGYTGTGAKLKPYDMYEYTDLVRERAEHKEAIAALFANA